jgi:2-oxoglutarate dehydrogenase E1 component
MRAYAPNIFIGRLVSGLIIVFQIIFWWITPVSKNPRLRRYIMCLEKPQINFGNMQLLEEIYDKYRTHPEGVDPSWENLFNSIEENSISNRIFTPSAPSQEFSDIRILNLIQAYRTHGYLLAKTNPLSDVSNKEPWQLQLNRFGFTEKDMNREYPTFTLLPVEKAPLAQIIKILREIYCDKVGIEYMGSKPEIEKWLQQQIETSHLKINLTIEQKKMILQQLNKSELLELFLHTKYTGQKRFSIEGGETLIPMMEAVIEKGSNLGVEDFVIGMAHRGRLNVLSNILHKSYSDIFSEFEEGYIPDSFEGSGDVKYHKGFTSDIFTAKGHKIKIELNANPSHLEAVDPVVEGECYAKQILKNDTQKEKVLPLLIHGDAAISGQGVIYETMQLHQLEGYSTGGTIHIVINNQIGFTTLPKDSRSTDYCTDIARSFSAPVFHVNAEDPEGCIFVTSLAVELRQKFHCDVFIDLVCYRKFGHNEGDEPAFTQPLEYKLIRQKKSIREIYRDLLISQGVLEKQIAESLEVEFKKGLQEALDLVKKPIKKDSKKHLDESNGISHQDLFPKTPTGCDKKTLQTVAQRFSTIPDGFHIHPKLKALIAERLSMVQEGTGGKPIDWGMGETLTYGTLLWEGISVRIAGQDSCRGTFSHRHALWVDQVEERTYFPLKHLKESQGRFDVINTPLSEFAALGFEFGYSLGNPKSLVIWEAQFGDFCNGGQVVIDEFISTSEQKWAKKSGLVMMLPHGYEGQGPDHSSGRMERFLALAGNNNITVANPTTPAQLFHLLRRQILAPMNKPLIVFTPKGLLRYSECVSKLEDFTDGFFQDVLHDPSKPNNVKKLVFCSGRVYYDLIVVRATKQIKDMAIIRLEQLYPLDVNKIKEIIGIYKGFKECFWFQEEPCNMGAWHFLSPYFAELLPEGITMKYIGRERSASPAVGSFALHKKEFASLLEALFHNAKKS